MLFGAAEVVDRDIAKYQYIVSFDFNKYFINKVKILNHKWIIADFSNGNRWGEMWIEYHFNENEINFYIKDYFLY